MSLPDALNFYISPDTKVLSHFVPLLVSCRLEHLLNSCVLTLLNFQQVYPFVALQVLSERSIWRLVCRS